MNDVVDHALERLMATDGVINVRLFSGRSLVAAKGDLAFDIHLFNQTAGLPSARASLRMSIQGVFGFTGVASGGTDILSWSTVDGMMVAMCRFEGTAEERADRFYRLGLMGRDLVHEMGVGPPRDEKR
ncbi:MAG: hypothetical protein H6721_31420 [Sandaracinus sp.]|nr:hypothetical protein [Sandaracinus sp.]